MQVLFKKTTRLLLGFKDEFKLVTGEGCKSKKQQYIEIIQLILRCQFTPEEYYKYKFYKSDKSYKDILNYLSNFHLTRYFRPALNDPEWYPVIRNKLLFNIYYRTCNLPVTKIYGYYDQRSGYTDDGKPLTKPEELTEYLLKAKPATLVIKPLGGGEGKNIMVLDKIYYEGDEVAAFLACGKKISLDEIKTHIQREPSGYNNSGYLLEEKVEQHELIKRINPSSLNTIRMITLLNRDQNPVVIFAIIRFGRAGTAIDNTSQGGLFAAIDSANGIVGSGVGSAKYGGRQYTEHPDTGVSFLGLEIPYWNEVVQLCTTAARLSPFCRSIGWDIGISPDGPVLIEGNDNHSLEIQTLFGGYLRYDVRKELARFDLSFPENELPSIKYIDLATSLKGWLNKK